MTKLSNLERQKSELLYEFSGWTPSRLAYRPDDGGWSALQMLDHLIRTEREILLVVYRNEGSFHRFGITDRLRTRLLIALFRTDRKVKVPSSASVVLPGNGLGLSVLTAEWAEVRERLAQNIERLLESYSGSAVFRHPVAGWMDMHAVLEFLSVHLVHHGYQLKRLRIASEHLQQGSGV